MLSGYSIHACGLLYVYLLLMDDCSVRADEERKYITNDYEGMILHRFLVLFE